MYGCHVVFLKHLRVNPSAGACSGRREIQPVLLLREAGAAKMSPTAANYGVRLLDASIISTDWKMDIRSQVYSENLVNLF